MAQETPNRLGEWLTILRRQIPVVKGQLAEWTAEVRAEPRLIWETLAVRYATYGICGLMLAWGATGLIGMFAPPPPPDARAQADTADFHVICGDPSCGRHFVIHREFGFDDFPVECPQCRKRTGVAARRCSSPSCNGRWIAPRESAGHWQCPVCGQPLE